MRYQAEDRQQAVPGRPVYQQPELRDPPAYHPGPPRGQQGYHLPVNDRQRYYDLKANNGQDRTPNRGQDYKNSPRYDRDGNRPQIRDTPRRGDNPYDNFDRGGNQTNDLPNIDPRFRRNPQQHEENFDQRNIRKDEPYNEHQQRSQGTYVTRQDTDRQRYPDRDQPNTQRGPNNQVPLHSRGSVRPNVLPQHDKLFLDSPAHGTPRLNQPYANTDRRNRDPFGPDPYYENSSPQHMAPIQGPAHPQYSGRSHPPPRRIENNNGLRPFSEQIPNRVEGGLNQDQGRRSESQIIDKRTGKQFSKENSNVPYLLRNNSRTKSSIRGSGVTRPANVTGQTTQGRPEDNRGHARVSQGQTNDDSKTRNTAVKGIMSGRRSDLERETAQKKTVEFQDGNKQINSDLKIVEPIDQTKNDSGKTKQEGIGSKTGYEFPDVDDLDDVNLEDVEGVYEGKDIYMCYLKTEQGALVGPLRFDIEDISIGLPDTESSEDKLETQEGMKYRQTGSHGLNETSSRSHSMMTLAIDSELQDPEDENLYITKRGKLTFVDLAGSEKVKDSHSTAETLIESNNINRSLLVLGNCISCLGDHRKRGGHVPYRDSKLTKLLADSLGGSGVTLMIACITPSSHHISETMNTLRYASRAKKIRTKPLIKMDPREKLIMSLKREIKILRNENQYLRQQLEFPEKTKAAMQNESDEKYKKFLKDQENNKSSDQPKKDPKSEEAGLYEMLQEYMIENEALRTENADLHATKDKIRREQQLLYKDNEKMMKRIEDLERLIGPTAWRRPPIDPYSQPSSNAPSQVQSPRQSPALQYRSPQPSGQPFPIGQQGRYPSQEQYAVAPSPNGTARGKGPPPPPPPNNSKPRRPPHRLAEPIMRPAQIPPDHQNGGPAYDHPPPSMPQQHMANGPIRQESPARMDSRATSQLSNTESVRSMNEKLKQELVELEGEIAHHQNMNQRTRSSMYGSQASIRSGPR